jgi:hypothetical protein
VLAVCDTTATDDSDSYIGHIYFSNSLGISLTFTEWLLAIFVFLTPRGIIPRRLLDVFDKRYNTGMPRRSFSQFSLSDAIEFVGIRSLTPWALSAPPQPLSVYFQERLHRLEVFDTTLSEAAKLLVVDAFFEEALQPHRATLKTFKEVLLRSSDATGNVDYLVSSVGAVPTTPFLLLAEAKKDDFSQGLAQCLVEMHTAAQVNAQKQIAVPIFGIVTNGSTWQFYRRDTGGQYFETLPYGLINQELLLGALSTLCDQCAQHLSC